MNRYCYPVVRMTPTDAVVVAEHHTYAAARAEAARLDIEAGSQIVWHLADEPATDRVHARTH